MEVHHHSHSSRKKWTHYFWEFLMLFLAVFCGFLAEYQLEHKIEKDREKQFIRSLYYDIKADTSSFNRIIIARNNREVKQDSILLLLNSATPANYSKDLYFHAVTAARTLTIRLVPNDGTMQQLKNSGAFRLIRKRAIVDSIAKYDVMIRSAMRQGDVEESVIHDFRFVAPRIFNALVFNQMLDKNNIPIRIDGPSPALLNFEKKDLELFNYRLFSMKSINNAIRIDIRSLKQQAENLLKLLNESYHLE
jgi:hypothetical protein